MSRRSGSGDGPRTPATVAAATAGVAYSAHEYEHDPAAPSYGLEAAAALGVEADSVFKTLLAEVDGVGLVVGIVPVTAQLDLKALAIAVGGKRASMADPRTAERRTGYVVGGISPIGQRSALPTVVDESSALWDEVYVSGGRRGFDIGLRPDDLVALTAARIADIARW